MKSAQMGYNADIGQLNSFIIRKFRTSLHQRDRAIDYRSIGQ